MTQIQKLIEKLMRRPTTFPYKDFAKIMEHLGFVVEEKGKTSGSRVRFYRERDERVLLLHIPHPGNELKAGTIRNIVAFLERLER